MIKLVKNLNNNGLTAIEVLVCFSIVVVITMSMFKVVNNQKDKQLMESYKNTIMTYKNTLTKIIEDDIRAGGGIKSVNSNTESSYSGAIEGLKYSINYTLKDNSTRQIDIYQNANCDAEFSCSSSSCTPESCDSTNRIEFKKNGTLEEKLIIPDIYNLKFNNTQIKKLNSDTYLKIYIGFNHPDLGNRYSALDLIEPINASYF